MEAVSWFRCSRLGASFRGVELLVFVAGEEVSVAVEGDGDAGVAHVGAEGFGVDAGSDHVGGVAVAAFVQAERSVAGGGPSVFGSLVGRAGVEGLVGRAGLRRRVRVRRCLVGGGGFGGGGGGW
jgi:hypothetical protein